MSAGIAYKLIANVIGHELDGLLKHERIFVLFVVHGLFPFQRIDMQGK